MIGLGGLIIIRVRMHAGRLAAFCQGNECIEKGVRRTDRSVPESEKEKEEKTGNTFVYGNRLSLQHLVTTTIIYVHYN